MVESVVTGAKGQVWDQIQYYAPSACQYEVRFPSSQLFTGSGVLSNAGPSTSAQLITIRMKEFELKEQNHDTF